MLAQAVRDYTNPRLRFSTSYKERLYYTTARDFLLGNIEIEWGGGYKSITDFLALFGSHKGAILHLARKIRKEKLADYWTHIHKNAGKLMAKIRVYLSGPIELTHDDGLSWRKEVAAQLVGIGMYPIIPHDCLPADLDEEQLRELKKADILQYKQVFRDKVLDPEIAALNSANVVIAYYDNDIITSGTHGECTHAFLTGTPVILVTPNDFETVPGWLLGCSHKEFHTFDEAIDYLK
jgi:hypothetical protein